MTTPAVETSTPPNWFKRHRVTLALGAVTLVLLWITGSLIVADRLTRRAAPRADEPLPKIAWATPQSVRLTTADGEDLGAWFIDGKSSTLAVILLHGNGGTRKDNLGIAEFLAAEGMPVLLVTLRCHGDSTGDRNDFGYSAARDVIAAVDFLESRAPGRKIVVLGRSLGAAAASFAAPALGHRVRAYVLDSMYKDLKTAVWSRVNNRLPPVLDSIGYAGLIAVSPMVLKVGINSIAPIDAIADSPADIPVLLISGTEDRQARPEEAAAIFERIASRATHAVFPGAAHDVFGTSAPGAYQKTVLEFLANSSRSPTPNPQPPTPAVISAPPAAPSSPPRGPAPTSPSG